MGLPTVNTGDSAALACFPLVPRSGVSTWRRMLQAVGHLAELPGSRSKNVEADSFTGQGPHPRRAKARRCTGHAGELVIPVPTNCVHMRWAAEWDPPDTGRDRSWLLAPTCAWAGSLWDPLRFALSICIIDLNGVPFY